MLSSSRVDRLGDEALLAAVGLGDPAAAVAFVRRFQRKVYGLALTITRDPVTAEDVAQQAFERAWRHAGAYDPRRARVATWLMTITRNLAIDELRVRRPQPVDPAAAAELEAAVLDDDPAAAAVRGDDVERIREALRALPEQQRRAVVLATVGCMTSTEIATLEAVPIPTAKHRIQSGLRKVQAAVRTEHES